MRATFAWAGESVSLRAIDWSSLRTCLADSVSENGFNHPLRDSRARGSLYVLDQRKGAFSCAFPRKDVIAWLRRTGKTQGEVTFVYSNALEQLIVKRYELPFVHTNENATFDVPETKAPCVPGSAQPEAPVSVKFNQWKLTSAPSEGTRHGIKEVFAIESTEPADNKLQLKEIGIPGNDEILRELLKELAPSIETFQDHFTSDREANSQRLSSCQKALASMEKVIPMGNLGLYSEWKTASNVVTNLTSIFVKEKTGFMSNSEFFLRLRNPEKFMEKVTPEGTR